MSMTTTNDMIAASPERRRFSGGDLIGLGIILLVAVIGYFLFPNNLALLTRIIGVALLVLSLDLVTGYCGVATLGHAALFGSGAYAAGIISAHYGINDPLLMTLAGIFGELLGLREIGIDDNFFGLGANSLMMVQVIDRIRTNLQIGLSLVRLFEFPTVSGLARFITDSSLSSSQVSPPDTSRGKVRKEMMKGRRDLRSRRL